MHNLCAGDKARRLKQYRALTRIIHDCFCCHRGFAAATRLDAADVASRQAGSLGDCAISRRTVMNNAG
jgi:hypothetical protein